MRTRLIHFTLCLFIIFSSSTLFYACTKEHEPNASLVIEKEKTKAPKKFFDEKNEDYFLTIYFDFDKYNIRHDQKERVEHNREILSKEPTRKIQIQGHCDDRGSVEYNMALGERRAQSLKNYFMEIYGIHENRLSTMSYGKEKPAVKCHPCSEREHAKNRRVEIKVLN